HKTQEFSLDGQCHFVEATIQIDQTFARLNIVQDFIPGGKSNPPGTKVKAAGVTITQHHQPTKSPKPAPPAKYQKGADARKRQVSWHFTVDDTSIYQSLPTNEIGWHAHNSKGNATTIGVEICMNSDLDVKAAYARAALLVAVLAFQNKINVP